MCEDAWNNTYSCVRSLSSKKDMMYCEFRDKEVTLITKLKHLVNILVNILFCQQESALAILEPLYFQVKTIENGFVWT